MEQSKKGTRKIVLEKINEFGKLPQAAHAVQVRRIIAQTIICRPVAR
jgi:hypothetical protein